MSPRRIPTCIFPGLPTLVVLWLSGLTAFAQQPSLQPQPGDLYREYSHHGGGNKDWRVTDEKAVLKFGERAQEFLPNPRLEIEISDLEHAVRATGIVGPLGRPSRHDQ